MSYIATMTDAEGDEHRIMLNPGDEDFVSEPTRSFQYVNEIEARYNFLYDIIQVAESERPDMNGYDEIAKANARLLAGCEMPAFVSLPEEVQAAVWTFLDSAEISDDDLVLLARQVVAPDDSACDDGAGEDSSTIDDREVPFGAPSDYYKPDYDGPEVIL